MLENILHFLLFLICWGLFHDPGDGLSCLCSVGTWKENVSVVVGWGVHSTLVWSCWLRVLLSSSLPSLIFLLSCHIVGWAVLASPTILVDLSFSLSFSQSFCSYVLQLWCHSCSFRIVMYCWWIDTNTGSLAFFWSMFAWYNLSHLFLSIHLYLYSWSESLVGLI